MVKNKRGSFFKVISAIVGAVLFLAALFFLNQENVLNAAIFGVIGILLITISALPFIKGKR
ncbi:MAG: hypothetical protein ABIH59_00770 [archaeon]